MFDDVVAPEETVGTEAAEVQEGVETAVEVVESPATEEVAEVSE